MIEGDIFYLNCIHCKANLGIEEYLRIDNEIIEGKIYCENCKAEWPIIKGIPRILTRKLLMILVLSRNKSFYQKYKKKFKFQIKVVKDTHEKEKIRTASSFGYEWLNYPDVINAFKKDWNRFFLPFIYPEDIKDRVVADIGCGMAKQGYFTAKYGAKYIGVDLSEAVEAAYENTKKFNSLIVQADIYHLPLKGDLIDFFYSIGVLHHLPTPKEGFLNIVDLMKKDSKLLIWVYSWYNNKRASYIYEPLRAITTKIPKQIIYYVCHIPAIITQFFNSISLSLENLNFNKLAKKIPFYYYKNFPYKFKLNDSFDILATPKQDYFTKNEIKSWFENGNFKDYKLIYDKFQGIKGFAEK